MSRYFESKDEPTTSTSTSTQPPPDSQTTLFVSRLPYTATSEDLSNFFSSIGPIRRAFIVTDQLTKKSKGVGYVSFTGKEDAQLALESLQGKTLDQNLVKGAGKRKIKLQWADLKPSLKERGEKRKGGSGEKEREEKRGEKKEDGYQSLNVMMEEEEEKAVVEEEEEEPHQKKVKVNNNGIHPSRQSMLSKPYENNNNDPTLAVRTVLLTGLASCKPLADSKTLYKKARKFGPVEEILYPVDLKSSSTSNSTSTSTSTASVQTDGDAAYIIFKTPNHALDSIPKFHNHIFKGALISAVLKKRADGAKKLEERMKPETKEKRERIRKAAEEEMKLANGNSNKGGKAKREEMKLPTEINRQSRLIVRNLPFDVTASDLRAAFLPFGPVYAIDLPKKEPAGGESSSKPSEDDMESDEEKEASSDKEEENEEEEPSDDESVSSSSDSDSEPSPSKKSSRKHITQKKASGRGFAFIWFISLSSAKAALENLNGKSIGKGYSETVLAKSVRGKKTREEAKKKMKEVREGAMEWREIAVDWAVGKKKWEELEKERDEKGEVTEAESGSDQDEDDDAEEKEDKDDDDNSDLDPLEIDENQNQDLDEEDQALDEGEEEVKSSRPPPPPEGTTIFVRNLPFTATDSDLQKLFRFFGPLRYARVTMEKPIQGPNGETSAPRSRGTGFVCFWEKEHADEVLERSDRIAAASGIGTFQSATGANSIAPGGAANPFSNSTIKGGFQPQISSVLTADTSAPLTSSLTLHGRLLSVTPAISRTSANQITRDSKTAREQSDKRNTYLMREGVPLPHVAKEVMGKNVFALGEKEKEKRLISFDARRSQLSKNPSLYVSKTRLSLRQLPLYCTDRTLKRLALHSRREFRAEVKISTREDLSPEEQADQTISPSVQLELEGNKNPRNKGGRPTAVLQSKVVRQLDRIDSTTGLSRSRGYGFIETRSHKDALMILRWANGNPQATEMLKTWAAEELNEMYQRVEKEVEGLNGNEKAEKLTRLKRLQERREELLKSTKKYEDGNKKGKAKGKKDEKAGDGDEDDEEKREIKSGSLVVEFSIENKNITRKRDERSKAMREGAKNRALRDEERPYLPASKRDSNPSSNTRKSKKEEEYASKPSRRPTWNQSSKPQNKDQEKSRKKAGDKIKRDEGGDKGAGGAIGRKRKEKRERKNGGK